MDKKEFTVQLEQRIRKLREEMGISRSELARRCGKDHQHMELIENGKTTCTSYTLYLICQQLNCSLQDVFDLKD